MTQRALRRGGGNMPHPLGAWIVRLVALLTRTGGRTTAAGRQPMAEAEPAPDPAGAPARPSVNWARARLREQIQRDGAEPAPAHQSPSKQPRQTDRAPYADREPEP
jgi:hypothetical protein